jgi:voltage-gated potassium channel
LGVVSRIQQLRLRARINWFFHKYDVPWTLFMAVLAVGYVGLGLVEDSSTGLLSTDNVQAALNVTTAIFVAEFIVRFGAAPSRWRYFKHHWIDLLAVLPSLRFLRLLGLARLAILLRLLRIARLGLIVHTLVSANRTATRLKVIGDRNGLPTLLITAFGFVWIGAGFAYEFEHGTNVQFANFGDAVWWAFSTMATLGYGTGPLTVPGRVVAGMLMVLGIACFGLITATVTTFILQRTEGAHEVTTGDLMHTLKDVQARMSRLEDELARNQKVST